MYQTGWLCALAALALVGMLPLTEVRPERHIASYEAYSSTDAIIHPNRHGQEDSARLYQALNDLPKDQPIAVLTQAKNLHATELGFLVLYLSWPRPAVLIENGDLQSFLSSNSHRYCAILVCGEELANEPPHPRCTHFGQALALLPLETNAP